MLNSIPSRAVISCPPINRRVVRVVSRIVISRIMSASSSRVTEMEEVAVLSSVTESDFFPTTSRKALRTAGVRSERLMRKNADFPVRSSVLSNSHACSVACEPPMMMYPASKLYPAAARKCASFFDMSPAIRTAKSPFGRVIAPAIPVSLP